MTYTVLDAAKDLVTGNLELASSETKDARMKICETCPSREGILNVCKQCGCYLPGKTALQKSSCPISKW